MANMDKVLIIGATGNVGSGVTQGLRGAGVEVRVLVRDEAKAQALRGQGVEVVMGDLDKAETLDAAFEGVSKLFLITSVNPNATKQASNAIAAAKQANVSHLVRLSALVPEPADKAILGRMHQQTDDEIKASGLPYTLLQPTFFMQNTMMAAQTVATDGMVYMPFKDGKVGMVDVRDVVESAVTALTKEGHQNKTYHLTGPASISFHDVAATLAKVLGKEVKYIDVPPKAAIEAMVGMGLPEWVANGYSELFINFSQGGGDRVTESVKHLTGHPARSYEQFVRDFAQAFGG
jgi:uncharacterized protein YbjT (DUF2867 family)